MVDLIKKCSHCVRPVMSIMGLLGGVRCSVVQRKWSDASHALGIIDSSYRALLEGCLPYAELRELSTKSYNIEKGITKKDNASARSNIDSAVKILREGFSRGISKGVCRCE